MTSQQRQEDIARIEQEFRSIDTDRNGKVDRIEMAQFLQNKGIDEEHRTQIIDELFSKCDIDGDGNIDIEEFTQQYTDTMDQLLEREGELKATIMDCHKQLGQAKKDLAQAKRDHGETGPMGGPDEENPVIQHQLGVDQWSEAIQNDVEVLKQVRIFIEQLQMPFGFLMKDIKETQKRIMINEVEEKNEEKEGDHRYHQQEQQAKAQFDDRAAKLASTFKINYDDIMWLDVSLGVTIIYCVLTMLTMFQRKDTISITICTCAIYVLTFPMYIGRQTFRGFVLMIFVSWVWDFFYLFMFTAAADEDDEDGGMEYNVRRFSRLFSYISFFFRIIVLAVFWKDSVDFNRIVRKKNPLQSQEGAADEGDFDYILAQYE